MFGTIFSRFNISQAIDLGTSDFHVFQKLLFSNINGNILWFWFVSQSVLSEILCFCHIVLFFYSPNLNMPLWEKVVKHRGARLDYPAWLCASEWKRRKADSCVFRLIDAAVYMQIFWLIQLQNSTIVEQLDIWSKSDNTSLLLDGNNF